MRILIGYDGSDSSEAILDDLAWAGLPEESSVKVVSAVDLLTAQPELQEAAAATAPSLRLEAALGRAEDTKLRLTRDAGDAADKAADMIVLQYPEWKVETDVLIGPPGWEILDAAEQWDADLIMVGSHDRPLLKRLFLGSVSRTVVTDSNRSVRISRRIARKNEKTPPYIIIGIDGSPAAGAAVEAVGRRNWPYGTQIRLVAAQDRPSPAALTNRGLRSVAQQVSDANYDAVTRQNQMLEWASYQLKAIGLEVSMSIQKGDAKRILLREAVKHKADSIFVGTREFKNSFERFRLGSVSMGVVKDAHCSVEVVRAAAAEEPSEGAV